MKSGIYKITNPKGRVYIGSSKSLRSRMLNYKNLKCKSQTVIYNSLLKYGFDNHTFEIVEYCNVCDLLERERHYGIIYDVLNKNKGLNCHIPLDKEGRIVFSDEFKKRKSNNSIGSKNPFFGKKHSEEAKLLISISSKSRTPHNKGTKGVYKASESAKENMRASQIGRKHSCITKLKMRESNKNTKIVLNMDNGIFYNGSKEASFSLGIKPNTLGRKLSGNRKNNTPFIFV